MSNHSFLSNVAQLVTASAVSQFIIFATTPVLTRLYDPTDFGIAAVFTAVILFISPVSSFSYSQAIVMSSDDKEAVTLAVLCLIIVMLVSVVLIVPFVFFNSVEAFSFNTPGLINYLWLIPVVVFLRGAYYVFLFESSREKSFTTQAYSKLTQTIVERTMTLGAGFLGYATAGAMIISRVFSFVAEAVCFINIAISLVRKRTAITYQAIRVVALKYRQFPLYANWSYIFGGLSAYLPIFLLAYFFTPEITGLYAISDRLLLTPLALLGESLRRVYYQKAASQQKDFAELKSFFLRLREKLIAYSIFPFLAFSVVSTEIFSVFLGNRWEKAGMFAGIIGFLVAAQFISTPVSSLINVLEKQREYLIVTVMIFFSRLLAFLIGGLNKDVMLAIWLFVSAEILIYVAMHMWIDSILQFQFKKTLIQTGKHLLFSAPFIAILWLGMWLYPNKYFAVAAFLFTCSAYYMISVYRFEGVFLPDKIKTIMYRLIAQRMK